MKENALVHRFIVVSFLGTACEVLFDKRTNRPKKRNDSTLKVLLNSDFNVRHFGICSIVSMLICPIDSQVRDFLFLYFNFSPY